MSRMKEYSINNIPAGIRLIDRPLPKKVKKVGVKRLVSTKKCV